MAGQPSFPGDDVGSPGVAGQAARPAFRDTLFGGHKDLSACILAGRGVSRTNLNVTAFFGAFLVPVALGNLLLYYMYRDLGQKKRQKQCGISLLVAYAAWIFSLMASASGGTFVAAWVVGFAGLAIYVGWWVYANMVLSRCKAAAQYRLADFSVRSRSDIDSVMEKGLIFYRVLRKQREGIDLLVKAADIPGGNPLLLAYSGLLLSSKAHHGEASHMLDRALPQIKDAALVRRIEKARAFIAKKHPPSAVKHAPS